MTKPAPAKRPMNPAQVARCAFHRAGRGLALFAGVAALAFSAAAAAQADCSKVPEQYRARCEEALRVKAACAGLEGEALKNCELRHYNYGAATENCASLAGEAKLQCDLHNRTMQAVGPCRGKVGADLEACIKTQAALRAH